MIVVEIKSLCKFIRLLAHFQVCCYIFIEKIEISKINSFNQEKLIPVGFVLHAFNNSN